MNIIVQTPRITVREFNAEEENIYLNHFTNEEVILHLPKRSREERINIFRTALANYAFTQQTGIWGMFDNTNGNFIGSCLLRPFEGSDRILELGYSMDKSHWGKGIATEMAIAVVNHAFTYETTDQIVGVTTLENTASQNVLQKAGLIRQDDVDKGNEVVAFFRKERA